MTEHHTALADKPAAPWLGPLPGRWSMKRGKDLFVQAKKPVLPSDETVTCFRDGTVTLRRNRRLSGYTEAVDFSGYQGVDPGDLVIHQMDGFAGAIGVSDSRGRCSPVCAVCLPRDDADPKYFAHVLRYMAKRGWIAALSRGIRERSTDFRFKVFANQRLPLPPLDEQRLIVRFLDHKELEFGRALSAKGEVLTRLHELRSAVIAQTVLGSDPGRRLAGSLPYHVPAHWEVVPFWSIATERSEAKRTDLELLSVYLDRGVIRYSESSGQVHKPSLDLTAYQRVMPGDLVLNNQQAWRGSVGVSPHEGIVSPAYLVYALDDRLDPRWANFLFRSPAMVTQFEIASRGVGSIQRQVHRPSLRTVRVPVPPLDEQREIAARILAATERIDAAAAALRREVDLLREYRTRLIADVVTGKLDVRAEAAALPEVDPDEIAEAQAADDIDLMELEVAHAD